METSKAKSILTTTKNKDLKIAIQGYSGAFHDLAAQYFYQTNHLQVSPADTFEELVEQVENKKVDAGIMAIENTLAGSLLNNYKLLYHSKLQVVGEVYLRIRQNLMVWPGVKIEDLKEVHSHPVAIDQCKRFFKQYPHIRLIKMEDTALSAKQIRENKLLDRGGIASSRAAEIYGLEIIGKSIETNKKNFTRFLILNREEDVQEKPFNKVSIRFTVKHEVGSLHIVLASLAINQANLTKIQSVPIVGKNWEYAIFLDFILKDSSRFDVTIRSLKQFADDLKVLGKYQKGEHHEG
ncbi:MAG TPA: prephenate dehydratase [Saprospiraceae bacterium]|nr:prephenate dehydratase [Saprospiraceae bacterium]